MTIPSGYQLVWNDEFTNPPVDTTKWRVYDENTHPNKYWRASQCVIENNLLKTKAVRDAQGKLNVGRLSTKGKKSWQYGLFETRAKISNGNSTNTKGLSNQILLFYNDPYTKEIDVLESSAYYQSKKIAQSVMKNRNPTTGTGQIWKSYCYTSTTDFSQDFHIYSLEWTPTFLKWRIDNIVTYTVTDISFIPDTYMWFALGGLCLGNCYPSGHCAYQGSTTVIDAAATPSEIQFDYVRVYQPTTLECPNPVLRMTI